MATYVRDRDFKWNVRNLRGRRGSLSIYPDLPVMAFESCHLRPKVEDPYNGISLMRQHHNILDDGLYTFNEDARILWAPMVPPKFRRGFGIDGRTRLIHNDKKTMEYVRWHRENVFLPNVNPLRRARKIKIWELE